MAADVTEVSMSKRFTLITHRSHEILSLLCEGDQQGSAFTAGKMEKVGPDQEHGFMCSGRSGAGGALAGASTGAGARSAHGHTGARGCGTRARAGEVAR
jgi:hypothetical protein